VESEEDDVASIYDNDTSYNSGDDVDFAQTNGGDWRKTHEGLLHNIRKAKRAATKSAHKRFNSAKTSSSARDNKDEGLGK